jgi:PKD repeat protein
VINPFGSDTYTRNNYIRVTETKPLSQFSATPRSGGAPLSVQFIDQSIGAVTTWLWNFGDQTISTERNPQHPYSLVGNYTVILTVSGPGGSDTKTVDNFIQVAEPAPVASYFASPMEGNAPLIVQFSDMSTGVISSWSWDFGDGSVASFMQNPGHLYNQPGRYTVRLLVIGPGGSDMEVKEGYIIVHPPAPHPDFSASPLEGEAPLIVQFQDLSTGMIDSWIWDFGDGMMGQGQYPTHTYTQKGTYTIKLTASGPGGANNIIKLNMIQIRPPSLVAQNEIKPTTFQLYQNYPNPFNGSTTIEYQVPKNERASLAVYDIRGNMIAELFHGTLAAGHYKTVWNGCTDSGTSVASGVYMVRFEAGLFTANQKVVYIK